MTIRCTAKAVILRDGQILVNRCQTKEGEIYYDLPGGGQHVYESMEEAVVREVLEETGYQVKVDRFLAVAEEICEDPAMRERAPEYAHRIRNIFLAHLVGEQVQKPTELDYEQLETRWVSLEEADRLPFLPRQLTGKLSHLVEQSGQYLGTVRVV